MERLRTVKRKMVDVRLNVRHTSKVPIVKVRKLTHIVCFSSSLLTGIKVILNEEEI